MASIYIPERFVTLRRHVADGIEAASLAHSTESRWLVALDGAKVDLASLGAVKPPNANERKEIEGGSITVEGNKTQLPQEYVQQTLQLAQFLDVSEHYAASLLQAGQENRVKWGRSAIDTACILFHYEQLALLGTLKELLSGFSEASIDAEARPGSWELATQLANFIQSLIETEVAKPSGGHTSLVRSLLVLLDSVEAKTLKLTERVQAGFSQPGSQFFSDDLIYETITHLKQEAQDAGHVLAMLAFARQLRGSDTQTLLTWLSEVPTSKFGAHAVYVLTAALAALEPSDEWIGNNTLTTHVTDLVSSSTRWKAPAIGSVVALQWVLTSVDLLPAAAGSAVELTRQQERLQEIASKAIQSGAFAFLSLDVLAFRAEQRKDTVWQASAEDVAAAGTNAQALTKANLDPQFQTYVLDQVQRLVMGVTSVMLPLLKRIQRAEDDAVYITSRGRVSADTAVSNRNDIQQLYDLIATLCSDRPESGLAMWTETNGRPAPFLLWAIDTRDPKNQLSLLDMLGALANGAESATHAYNLLANYESGTKGFIAWSRLFEWVQYYIDVYAKATSTQEMDPTEVNQLVAFLHLLRNVVYYSHEARTTILQNPDSNALARLFKLSLLHIHAELKAALFEALAAFARKDNRNAVEVIKEIWELVSTTDLLGTGKSSWNPVLGRQVNASGAIYQLEHVEAEQKAYPSTAALVAFLSSVVPYIPQGTDAYVTFVRDVFLKTSTREYADPNERWKLTVVCLEFFMRCLTTFRLEDPQDTTHPELESGFLIAKDILLNEQLAREIFALLNVGFETLNATSSALLTATIKVSMQCLKRVFEVQDKFLRDLLPFLTDAPRDLSRLGTVANYAPLDQHLLYSNQTVVSIALYINASSVSVAMLSIQLMGYLASSASFSAPGRFSIAGGRKQLNRLAGLLEMMGEASRVRTGYIRRLTQVDHVDLEEDEEELGGDDTSPARPESIRMAILKFLISHLRLQPPNVAHLLLGYDLSTTAAEAPPLPDPSASTTEQTVLSAILALIRPDDGSLSALLAQHPDLTELCFQLLLDLCSEPYSSSATLRYLRTYENFMASHLPAIPFAPTTREAGMGAVVYSDQVQVQTSVNAVVANLRIKASLLEMVALQIHAVTNAGMMNVALPLVGMLIDPQRTVGVQLINLLRSLMFKWSDVRDPLRDQMTLLAAVNDETALLPDGSYDLDRARSTILLARGEMKQNGELVDPVSRETFERDSAYWIRWLVAQNARSLINSARQAALNSWRHALGMMLSRCSTLFRSEERINVLFLILTDLLPKIATSDDSAAVATISGSVLELIASLRATSKERADLRYDMFPSDRVLITLRSLVTSILLPTTSMFARGNLYSALINFLQFAHKDDASAAYVDDWDSDIPRSSPAVGSVAGLSVSTAQSGMTAIMLRVRMTLAEKIEQLVMRTAKDALDAPDVWRAVSYTLLDKLTALEGNRTPRPSRVLDVLVKQGYLKAMVSALRDSDLALQECLRPNPSSFVALPVYQAQMAFFVRLATSRAGVDTLLDLGLITTLAQADFIAASPESNQGFADMEGFLPAARERYAELLTPALELTTSMLSISPVASEAISALLAFQADALTIVLQSVLTNVVSIGQVQQANLLVILLGLLAGQQSAPLAISATNYHTQLLAVASGFLAKPAWVNRVLASNDTERAQCNQVVARDGQTMFNRRALLAVERLQQGLLTYLEAVSRPATLGGSTNVAPIKPVFTSSIAPPVPTTGFDPIPAPLPLQRTSTSPSIGAAVQALEEEVEKLSVRVARLDKALTIGSNPTTVSIDDLEELLGIEGNWSSSDLNEAVGQPALTTHLLRRRARTLQGSIAHSLSVIELLLVLLYRHLDYFLTLPDSHLVEQADARTTTTVPALVAAATTQRGTAHGGGTSATIQVDKQRLSRFGLDRTAVLTEGAMEINLNPTHLADAPERGAFIEMLLRKIQHRLC